MRGGTIFLIFFVLFSAASYAVPVPLFPGNMVMSWFTSVPAMYAPLISALVNGIVYGCIVWLVFILVTRKFEEPQVTDAKNKKSRNLKRH
jgi:hypothetical protein